MQEIIDNCIAGEGLKSNWPEMPACKPRKTIEKHAVDDENGMTIFISKDKVLAKRVQLATGGSYRHVVMDDEEQTKENKINRDAWKWQNQKSH